MKILVDKMPYWNCPFAKPIFVYLDDNENERRCARMDCKIDDAECDLHEKPGECKIFKELVIKMVAQ